MTASPAPGSQPPELRFAEPSALRIIRIADVARQATAGMSGYMLSSGAEMTQRGHAVSFWFRDQLAPRLTVPGLRRLIVPWVIAANVVCAVRRGEHYDIVEIHEPLSAPYALAAKLTPRHLPPCVVLSYGLEERAWQALDSHLRVYGRRPALRSRILVPLTLLSQARAGLRMAPAVLVPSSEDRDYLITRLRIPSERVSCAFTGVSEGLLTVSGVHGLDSGVRFLFLGSWLERKGTSELLVAWRRLAAARPDVHLTLAGVGAGEKARGDLEGLPRVQVIETVERDDLAALLARHDVFVLPSWFEGMALSMLEAAAAGLGCVVCSVCGNLDVFRPDDPRGDGGLLVPPSDAHALHRALATLAEDGQLRQALGARARERARQFSWARNADQTLAGYRSAIQRHRRRGAG